MNVQNATTNFPSSPPFTASHASTLLRRSVVFEDAGRLTGGLVFASSDSSLQVELVSGKRQKLKWAQIVFADKATSHADLAQLFEQAQASAAIMDLPLCWECAPEADFVWSSLAQEYFGAQASAAEQLGTLLCLHQAPHYFRRLGKGAYRKATREVLAQALSAIAKKQQQQAQIAAWSEALQQGVCPPEVEAALYAILFAPDKNSPAYKAVALAAHHSGKGVLPLLQAAGALRSAYDFHWQRFVYGLFPKERERGLYFSAALQQAATQAVAACAADLTAWPWADVAAFSIDDSLTTEIDDAFSLQNSDGPVWTLGIHIAAPSLAISSGSELDVALRERMTTVYFPGAKITMMPQALVQSFSLDAGKPVPALSLYCKVDAATLALSDFETRIERLEVAANLRHDVLETQVHADSIAQLSELHPELPFAAQLQQLHRLAQHLKAAREQVRGKPETFNRPDYQFEVACASGQAWPGGEEPVQIRPRLRGSPLDLLVAELMIVANNYWGGWLAQLGLPAAYRSQASLTPGVKVRMGTRALPHAGMGVPHYAWCTSPLRRYVDFMNQGQIVAAVRYGNAAALRAPFAPRDATLLALIQEFEAVYSSVREFQERMERYWTLRYIAQEQCWQQSAAVLRDGLVRLEHLPLVLNVPATNGMARAQRVLIHLEHIDAYALTVSARLLQKLEAALDASGQAPVELEGADAEEVEEAETAAAKLVALASFTLEVDSTAGIIPADGEGLPQELEVAVK